jgi:excisionase family DNA binding protein
MLPMHFKKDSYKDRTYLSTMEIAEYLGVSRISVFRWIKKLKLNAGMVGGRYLVPLKDVEELINKEVDMFTIGKIRMNHERPHNHS